LLTIDVAGGTPEVDVPSHDPPGRLVVENDRGGQLAAARKIALGGTIVGDLPVETQEKGYQRWMP
jgi:hypothetical protein